MSLQPNSVVTGAPIISTAGRLDNSQITDWYAWFFEPISYTDGIDDSQITDWYAWFFEPITYAGTELTQAHDLSSVGFTSSSPEIQPTSVTEIYPVVADNILVGTPIIGTSGLTEDYNLLPTNITTGPVETTSSSLTQVHSVSAPAILSDQVVISTAGLIQAHSLQANDLTTDQSEATDPVFTQSNNLSADDVTTAQADVSSATMAEDETFSTGALETGSPDLANADLNQDHSLSFDNVLSGSPAVENADLSQAHSFSAETINTDTPAVNTPTITQDHDLSTIGFDVGTPLTGQTTVEEILSITVDNLTTGPPSLAAVSLTQDHSLDPNSIVTPVPDIDAATDPEKLLAQETQEIEQMIGGWTRRAYEVPDGRLVQGEREIQQTYGDKVSIDRKAKSLVKFGRSAELGTGSLETVWSVGGNETYLSTNSISHVSSSSASDTQEVTIEGHTLSNSEFTFVSQTATLNGQNTVALNTDLARVSRVYNSDSTELVGRVVAYENTALSGGVPTDATKIHIDIPAGFQQSFKGATTFSKNDYFIMTSFYGAVSAKQSGSVDFYPEIRQVGKVFRQVGCFTASTNGGSTEISLDPPLIVPKNADIRIRCETETNNLVVFGIFKGYIAKVL